MNIVNTYAPYVSYGEETHNEHWAETREITNSIPKNNAICRRTENNGQITQDEYNNEQIGKWAVGKN